MRAFGVMIEARGARPCHAVCGWSDLARAVMPGVLCVRWRRGQHEALGARLGSSICAAAGVVPLLAMHAQGRQ
jgi:hypothetical protein